MSPRTVKLRPAARRDVIAAAQWYAKEGGATLADRFISGARVALDHIGQHPASGSLRFSASTGMTGLRNCQLKGFPYLVFYVEHDTWVDVLRVLHASRDIPESLRT